jgi:hypothetical protein
MAGNDIRLAVRMRSTTRRHVQFSRGTLMAKKSKIAKNKQGRKLVARCAERQAELKGDHSMTVQHAGRACGDRVPGTGA